MNLNRINDATNKGKQTPKITSTNQEKKGVE